MEGNGWIYGTREAILLPLSYLGDTDYTSLSMDLTFNSATTSQMVTVNILPDTVIEDDEMFTLSLMSDDNAVNMLSPQSANVTITDTTSKNFINTTVEGCTQLPVSYPLQW